MACALMAALPAHAGTPAPDADRAAFRQYFHDRFPSVPLDDFANGPYAVDAGMRRQWTEIMQFPPYEFALDDGRALFGRPFADGRTYADCLPGAAHGISQTYPRFDPERGAVVTLPDMLNRCRAAHGEAALPEDGAPMAALLAYLAFASRGKPIAVTVPDDPRARAAYDAGKTMFYAARGPAGASCAQCHVQGAGEVPGHATRAPALGMPAAYPVYASGRGEMVTLARQAANCDAAQHVAPPPPGSDGYRNLEYFLAVMSDGIAVAGPGVRP